MITAPDQIRLNVQVNTRAESASEAMAQASKKTSDILAVLKGYGIDSKDIQTSRVTVSAILDYQRNIQPPPIVGYSGVNEFTVLFKSKLMDRVGEFLDKAVALGVSNFSGLMYESSKQRELERDALRKAPADAHARAEVLAKELGATLGRVMSISESGSTFLHAVFRSGVGDGLTCCLRRRRRQRGAGCDQDHDDEQNTGYRE